MKSAEVVIAYNQDKSTDIRTMLADLQNNVLGAVLLVMIVIVAALGLRSAGLVGIAIPGSFLAGILVLAAFGLTFATVLTLVTPSAMMLRENLAAWRRRRHGKPPPPTAAIRRLESDLPEAAE